MTRQLPVHSPPRDRHQSTFENIENATRKERRGVREFAGGTTAECAAVCCCCPCAVINLLVVAVYKVPVGLCRRAAQKKKRRNLLEKKRKDGLRQQRSSDAAGSENIWAMPEDLLLAEIRKEDDGGVAVEKVKDGGVSETSDLEKEMLAYFNGTGFWRSYSRREEKAEVEQ